jgi:aryl-alcohol dehydrogenase-like predicted oxidoreductase
MDHEWARGAGTLTIAEDLTVTRLGYGVMRLTGPGIWGEYPDRAGGIALLKRVVEAGITFIDTADAYEPHTNETLIHDALHPYPADLVLATKGGFIRGGPDRADFGAVGNREYLRQCAYLSARRLVSGSSRSTCTTCTVPTRPTFHSWTRSPRSPSCVSRA